MLGFAAEGLCPTSAADVEATEARLEAAGVEDADRARIHQAVARAAAFLMKCQEEDGSFKEHWKHGKRSVEADPIRTTLLCALALRHVGTEAANKSARRAATWVLAQDAKSWGAVSQNVQSAGLALMLRDVMPEFELPVEATAVALAGALDEDTGYWSYSMSRPAGSGLPGIRDSQLAVLGLWCARRHGVKVPAAVWDRHARALAKEQTRSGSWRWHPDKTLKAMGHPADPSVDSGIAFGRYVGLASLRLASAALEETRAGQSRRKTTVKKAMRRLDSEAAATLVDPARMFSTAKDGRGKEWRVRQRGGSPDRPGDGAYLKLWALGTACILHDLGHYKRTVQGSRRAEKRSWYLDAAEWLLSVQDASGGWSPTAGTPVTPPSEIDTAYALLFLVRAAAALHPDAPAPVGAQKDAGGDGD